MFDKVVKIKTADLANLLISNIRVFLNSNDPLSKNNWKLLIKYYDIFTNYQIFQISSEISRALEGLESQGKVLHSDKKLHDSWKEALLSFKLILQKRRKEIEQYV